MTEVKSFKIVLVGDSGVGKTTITRHYISPGEENVLEAPTISADWNVKSLKINGCTIELQIWDTAGQEQFKSLGPLYYRGSQAGIMVFDLTNEESFQNLRDWIANYKNAAADGNIFIVGNKLDLLEDQTTNTDKFNWSEKEGYHYFQVSGLVGTNVNTLFEDVAQCLANHGKIEGKTLKKNKKPHKFGC